MTLLIIEDVPDCGRAATLAGGLFAYASKLRFWTIFDGNRQKLPFPPAVFTMLSENNSREKLLR